MAAESTTTKPKTWVTNPNGANQYVYDPRQIACWKYYTDHKSETFGNATQSAIKAGYTETTADHITLESWFIGKLRRLQLLDKAEEALQEAVTLDWKDETGKPVPSLLSIKTDVAKFLAKTQGKNEGYSERQELTGKDGSPLPTPILGAITTKDDVQEDNSR